MILEKNWMEDDRKRTELGECLTTKEAEALYNLPINAVLQDIRTGKVRHEHIRQSGKIWLITRIECNRLYSNYKRRERRKRELDHVS